MDHTAVHKWAYVVEVDHEGVPSGLGHVVQGLTGVVPNPAVLVLEGEQHRRDDLVQVLLLRAKQRA